MKEHLRNLSNLRNRYLIALDILVLLSMPGIALAVRVEDFDYFWAKLYPLLMFTVFIACVKLVVLTRSRLYSHYWAYASSEELLTLIQAIGYAFLAEQILSYSLLYPLGFFGPGFPRSVAFLDGVFSSVCIAGIRLGIRLIFSVTTKREHNGAMKPVLIAGAGAAGTMVAKELLTNPHLGLAPVGYVDDNPTKIGKTIHGVRVLGPLRNIPLIAKSNFLAEVIIAMPTAPGIVIREVMRSCKAAGVESKTVPGLFEIVTSSTQVRQIRPIRIEDLLRRGLIRTDTTRVADLLRSARVMITGAGGSIGSELCRQVKTFKPSELILLGHGENSIFAIERELKLNPVPGLPIRPVIADIRDKDRLQQVFRKYQPEVIVHAAAHKHVWLLQQNVCDAVTNNIVGTRNLVELAEQHRVSNFVMISTDKAVNPTSTLGVTKRIAELVVLDAARESRCAFVTVRFGNVLGSRGSVVPIFEAQIRAGGPVTVTHPDVRRYFMTIPESVQLVLQASAMGRGGEVFVLDMGEQIRIADVARDLIRLHGLEEDKDIRIEYTGLLPGEKVQEELFYEDEKVSSTSHEKLLMARSRFFRGPGSAGSDSNGLENGQSLDLGLAQLVAAAQKGSEALVDQLFKSIVPQYSSMDPTLHIVYPPMRRVEALGAAGVAVGVRDDG
jgi:FlaA1/EpsC-like NDP-sugar epimerase